MIFGFFLQFFVHDLWRNNYREIVEYLGDDEAAGRRRKAVSRRQAVRTGGGGITAAVKSVVQAFTFLHRTIQFLNFLSHLLFYITKLYRVCTI